ncbi:hypothetical protein NDU88_004708 [Pleurodeles waltl]|uniref:Uncharacterized protein n=1 Tax=Pleurodeles waltl TaxID=8319 RepID=A0AAV7MU88_PLEWA|nr:hypothetical protein NDU88_004708 [Pleurodeles waltl]
MVVVQVGLHAAPYYSALAHIMINTARGARLAQRKPSLLTLTDEIGSQSVPCDSTGLPELAFGNLNKPPPFRIRLTADAAKPCIEHQGALQIAFYCLLQKATRSPFSEENKNYGTAQLTALLLSLTDCQQLRGCNAKLLRSAAISSLQKLFDK